MRNNGHQKRGIVPRRKLSLHEFLRGQSVTPTENRKKVYAQPSTSPLYLPKHTTRLLTPREKRTNGRSESNVSFPVKYERIVKEISFEEYLKSIGKSIE